MSTGWCNLYKGLIGLVLFLIVMEYMFGTIEYNKHWDTMLNYYNNNNSNPSGSIPSPLIHTLLKHNHNKTQNGGNGTIIMAAITSPPTPSTDDAFANSTSTANLIVVNNNNGTIDALPLCPDNPPDLGNTVKVLKSDPPSVLALEARFDWLTPGGHSQPAGCRAVKKVAIVVPFRCRAEHLLLFLQHMHPFLRRQQLDYTMYIIEQEGKGAFNRATLMNVGYIEAMKIDKYDCFIFHDVDLLPEDERNIYSCPEMPRHMSVAVDVFDYALPYRDIFGGVSAITTEHFKLLNGFSNSFWGWGGEDDDMSNRIRYHRLYIARYPKSIAKYTMLTHKKEKANPDRYETLKSGKLKFDSDGLSNLRYTLSTMKATKLYTWLLVRIGPPEGR